MNKKQITLTLIIVTEFLIISFLFSKYIKEDQIYGFSYSQEVNRRGELSVTKSEAEKYAMPEDKIPKHSNEYQKESNNPMLIHELNPNTSQWFYGYEVKLPGSKITINSDGFRDKEYNINKANKTFRIIALGDSETFGRGINISDVWTEVLESKLNKENRKNYQVLNFGVPGYDTRREVEMLKEKGLKYNPDLVLIQYLGNDILNYSRIARIKNKILNRSNLSGYSEKEKGIIAYSKAVRIERENNTEQDISEVMGNNEKALKILKNISRNYNFSFVVFNVGAEPRQVEYLKELSNEIKFDFLNLQSIINDIPFEERCLSKYDTHFTPKAHRIIANKIYEYLSDYKGL